MENSKFNFKSIISGTKKFGNAAKQAGSSVKNNIGKAMSKAAETTRDMASASGEIGSKLAGVAGTLVAGIMNPLKGIVALFALAMKYIGEAEARAQGTARATGLMGKNLREAQGQVSSLHESYRFFGESIDGSIQTVQGMNNALGNVDYTTKDMAHHITKFSIGAGIGKETSAKIMSNMMLAQGSTAETAMQAQLFAKDLSNAAGVPINLVMDDLANISDNVSAYLGSNPEKLVRATIEARRLGLSLESTAKVADSLLDFESSIEKEMEAQILTGKTLNYDKARQLALQGDTVGAAKDLLAQVGGIGEFNKMNVVQQKALAASVGLSVVEMKKALGTGEKEKDLEEERAEKMAQAQMDQAKGIKIIATTAERLNATFHKLGKILATAMKPLTDAFMNFLNDPANQAALEGLTRQVAEFLTPAMEWLTQKLSDLFMWFKPIEDGGSNGFQKVKDAVIGVKDAAVWCFEAISGVVTFFQNDLTTSAEGILKFLVKLPLKLASSAGQAITKLFSTMGKGMTNAGSKLMKVFKRIPIIGALISFGFAVKRAMDGDWWGAGAEIVSGLASFIPGVGTAVSVGIDVGLVARDAANSSEEDEAGAEMSDFISRGNKTRRFRKDDLVIGGTNLDNALGIDSGGSGGGNTEIVAALNVIAGLLQQPATVLLDGRKVGEGINMAKSYVAD